MKFAYLAFLILIGCNYPKDPGNTLEKIKNSTIRVGIANYKGRCNYNNGNPKGPEVELIKGYAKSIGANIEWVKASQSEIVDFLKELQVDVGIGGFTKRSPWKKKVGFSTSYTTEKIKLAALKNVAIPEDIEDKQVLVKPASAALVAVKKNKGIPVIADSIRSTGTGIQLVAGTKEELLNMGLNVSDYDLSKKKYVIAIPKGENALLQDLENYIYQEWKNKRIRKSL